VHHYACTLLYAINADNAEAISFYLYERFPTLSLTTDRVQVQYCFKRLLLQVLLPGSGGMTPAYNTINSISDDGLMMLRHDYVTLTALHYLLH